MSRGVLQFLFNLGLIAMIALSGAGVAFAQGSEHPGYLSSVEDERYEITREVYISPLPPDPTPTLRAQIFTDKVSSDFQREYRRRFGYTEAEQLESVSNRFVEFETASGRIMPVNEHIEEQEAFGEYMAKELTETHVNKYLKESRSTRKIYRVKERISNVDVKTESGYEFKMRYRLSSNVAYFNFEKPDGRFHNRVSLDVGNSENVGMMLSYDISTTVQVLTDYLFENRVTTVSAIKKVTPNLKTSLTGQSWAKVHDSEPSQERVLLGLTWTD